MTDSSKINLSNSISSMMTSRRQLIKVSAAAAGSFSLGLALTGCATQTSRDVSEQGAWAANAWLTIEPDNRIRFVLDRVEMGQGTYTGITTLLAEELHVTPEDIEVEFAPAAQVYRNPDYGLQMTGGSNSMSSSWTQIRSTGAAAREMIMAAASEVFQVPEPYLKADAAHIVHSASGKKLTYGSLAKLAAKQDIPSEPTLTEPEAFKYICKQNKRLDSRLKVTGTANYGIDADIEGMRYAVVSRAPTIGAELVSHNGEALAKEPGVEAVVEIASGVAIVANSYWRARKAEEKLRVEWKKDPEAPESTQAIFDYYRAQAAEDSGSSVRSEGDFDDAVESASKVLDVEYQAPFLAHSTMEPMNCTAHIQEDRADIWTSTQASDVAQVVVAKVTDLSISDVTIHNQFIGGGFGRRLSQDFVGEAAEISNKVGGVIKLVWSREEDTQNDFYRPASLHRLRATIDAGGKVSGWDHQIVCPEILDWFVWDAAPAMFPWAPKFMYPMLGKVGQITAGTPITPADTSPYEGANNLPYAIPSIDVRHTKADAGVPVSYWRSVGHSHNAFVTEGFIDELATESGKDAYTFRRELLADSPRLKKVLDEVATKGQWGRSTEPGVFQGIAAHKSFGTYVAELVELKIEHGQIRVLKVVCAVDCGLVVNPDIVRMQMESCVIFGMTAALYGEITIENGAIQQSNFHDYEMLRMDKSPKIETIIVASKESPTGVGEPGLPPIAPAIAGALFAATGKRHRSLPFNLS